MDEHKYLMGEEANITDKNNEAGVIPDLDKKGESNKKDCVYTTTDCTECSSKTLYKNIKSIMDNIDIVRARADDIVIMKLKNNSSFKIREIARSIAVYLGREKKLMSPIVILPEDIDISSEDFDTCINHLETLVKSLKERNNKNAEEGSK